MSDWPPQVGGEGCLGSQARLLPLDWGWLSAAGALAANIQSAGGYVNLEDTLTWVYYLQGVSQVALVVKNPPANVGDKRDLDSIQRLGGSPREGNGNPLQNFYFPNLFIFFWLNNSGFIEFCGFLATISWFLVKHQQNSVKQLSFNSPEESHGQKSLGGYSPQSCKEWDTAEVTEHAWIVCRGVRARKQV